MVFIWNDYSSEIELCLKQISDRLPQYNNLPEDKNIVHCLNE
ncbi:hypothetical protein [Myxosarcina sp. GI1]|nr:hypothetical protein [Myxosarcina sp. GI1]